MAGGSRRINDSGAQCGARRRMNMMKRMVTTLGALLAAVMLVAAQPGFSETKMVNVNTATAAELTSISGIGESKAKAIVDYREKNGAFKTVDDLKLVQGIGDKLLEKVRPQVTVGAASDAKPVARP
jgi:competence protein ComEA